MAGIIYPDYPLIGSMEFIYLYLLDHGPSFRKDIFEAHKTWRGGINTLPMSPMADYRIYKHFTRGLSLERKRREGRSFWWLSPLGMVVASRIVARVAEMTTFKAEPKTFNVLYMKIPSQDAMRNSRNDNKHVTDLQKNEFFVETIAALTWQQARIVSHHSGSRYGENVYLLRVNQRSFKQPYNFYVQDISFICHFEPVRCGCTECLAKRGVIIQPGQNWSTRE